jgi:hypothetical protein
LAPNETRIAEVEAVAAVASGASLAEAVDSKTWTCLFHTSFSCSSTVTISRAASEAVDQVTFMTLWFDQVSQFHRLVVIKLLYLRLAGLCHEFCNLLFSGWLTIKNSHALFLFVSRLLFLPENLLFALFFYVFFLSIPLQLLQGFC